MVESFHHARAGYEFGEHLARHAAIEIDRLEQRRLDWIVGVDNDAAIPIRQPRQRLRKFGPIDRDKDDIGARGLLRTLHRVRDRCLSRKAETGRAQNLLLNFVMNLPEAHGAPGGFGGQLAVIFPGELQRLFRYRLLERPAAQDGFDRRPVQSG
jgi:hypothetical protein